jgi:hypothetical protein
VLAQGTGRDNRATSWSATSLKKYAGISWERGTVAIEQLIRKGFVRYAETSSPNKPRYELLSHAEVAEAAFNNAHSRLTDYERSVLREIQRGAGRSVSRKKHLSETLAQFEKQGLITVQPGGSYTVNDGPIINAPDLIWLPNTLVTGTAKGEDSPSRRLRGGGDIWTLRLFIDLYHAHNLRDNGGINPTVLRENYSRVLVGEQGVFKVWGFRAEHYAGSWTGPFREHRSRPTAAGKDHPIWESVNNLRNHGLLKFVPHLWDNVCDGERIEAEIIHGYGIGNSGEPQEVEIGRAAHEAGTAMVPDFKKEKAYTERYYHFAPVLNTFPKVQMIGVARLLYRPHTTRTSDWYSDLLRNGPGWIRRYEELREKAKTRLLRSPESMAYSGVEASRGVKVPQRVSMRFNGLQGNSNGDSVTTPRRERLTRPKQAGGQ